MTEALQYAYDEQDTTEGTESGWTIQDDQQAEWAIKQIRAAREDLDRWTRFYTTMIERMKSSTDNKVAFMTSKLEEYFRTVPHKESRTQEKYTLPSGDLVLKKSKEVWNHDDNALMQWAKSNGLSEFIKVKESVSWSDIKKRLTVDSNGILCDSETGLVCDGVTVSTEDARFVVNVND